jgi:hypothetical protein
MYFICQISGSHGGEYEDDSHLERKHRVGSTHL